MRKGADAPGQTIVFFPQWRLSGLSLAFLCSRETREVGFGHFYVVVRCHRVASALDEVGSSNDVGDAVVAEPGVAASEFELYSLDRQNFPEHVLITHQSTLSSTIPSFVSLDR